MLFFLNGVSGWKFEMILNEMIFELKCCREVLKCFFFSCWSCFEKKRKQQRGKQDIFDGMFSHHHGMLNLRVFVHC